MPEPRYISVYIDERIPLAELVKLLNSAGYGARAIAKPGLPFVMYVDDKPDRSAPLLAQTPLTEKGIGDTVYVYGECLSREAALAAIKEYVARYAPAGYGTVLSVSPVAPWRVVGQRYASCE